MTAPLKFRKKPVEIDAVQWDGTAAGATPIIDWILDGGGTARYHDTSLVGISPFRQDDINSLTTPAHIVIDTLEGAMRVSPRDWVIRGVQGEFYPCKPDIFTATYGEVVAAPDVLRPFGLSDGDLLTRMGTNAGRWAHEFMRIKREIDAADDDRISDDEGWMIGWFANAIEAGRAAGQRDER